MPINALMETHGTLDTQDRRNRAITLMEGSTLPCSTEEAPAEEVWEAREPIVKGRCSLATIYMTSLFPLATSRLPVHSMHALRIFSRCQVPRAPQTAARYRAWIRYEKGCCVVCFNGPLILPCTPCA